MPSTPTAGAAQSAVPEADFRIPETRAARVRLCALKGEDGEPIDASAWSFRMDFRRTLDGDVVLACTDTFDAESDTGGQLELVQGEGFTGLDLVLSGDDATELFRETRHDVLAEVPGYGPLYLLRGRFVVERYVTR